MICKDDYILHNWRKLSECAHNLLSSCLCKNSDMRIDIHTVIKHKYFKFWISFIIIL
jgi:hypothetical protein